MVKIFFNRKIRYHKRQLRYFEEKVRIIVKIWKKIIDIKLWGINWFPFSVRIYSKIFPLEVCQFDFIFSVNFTFKRIKVRGIIQAPTGIDILSC